MKIKTAISVIIVTLALATTACAGGTSLSTTPIPTASLTTTPTRTPTPTPIQGAYNIPVLVIEYFPTKDGVTIDTDVATYDIPVGTTIATMRSRTADLTTRLVAALEQGSTYHGYKDSSATPSLNFSIVQTIEYLSAVPLTNQTYGGKLIADYYTMMSDLNISDYVQTKGVKEVWIWGYAGNFTGWESNMAGPSGDISNSNRDPNDLPVCQNTYTVFHYNYGRELGMAIEDQLHQIEHVLNYLDGRDVTPPGQWETLLFWGRFVGRNNLNQILPPVSGCGWTHSPPNTEIDYDWYNKSEVLSDCECWNPDRTGERELVSCKTWTGNDNCTDDGGGLSFKIWWMQNIPGKNNNLSYQGKTLRNWWEFIGDFDNAVKSKGLTY